MQQRLGMLIPLLTSPILPLWVKLCTEGDLRLPPALCAIATLAVTLSQPVLAVTLSHSALCTVPALLEAAPCALWSSPGRATSQSLHKRTQKWPWGICWLCLSSCTEAGKGKSSSPLKGTTSSHVSQADFVWPEAKCSAVFTYFDLAVFIL